MRRVTFAFLLFTSPVAATASVWYVANIAADFVDFIDVSRMKRTGNVVTYWSQRVERVPYNNAKRVIFRIEDDCVMQTSNRLQFTEYDAQGTVGLDVETPSGSRYVLPDSAAEARLKVACAPQTSLSPLLLVGDTDTVTDRAERIFAYAASAAKKP